MNPRVARGAWVAYAAVGAAVAVLALLKWGQALSLAGPVLYGEGAVAHAAILGDGFKYADRICAPPEQRLLCGSDGN